MARFGIVHWAGGAYSWKTELAAATEENKQAAIVHIETEIDYKTANPRAGERGGTRHDLALKEAFSLNPETIYMLTDGNATESHSHGGLKPMRPQDIYRVAEEGQTRLAKKAHLHVIYYLNGKEKSDEVAILRGLASRNGGKFQKVEAKGGRRRDSTGSPSVGSAAGSIDCAFGSARDDNEASPGDDRVMRKVNVNQLPEEERTSPKGKFHKFVKDISIALGREKESLDLTKRHPFDLAQVRIPKGKSYCPYHGHSAETEMYLVVSGRGIVRHRDGTTEVTAGDSFFFPPGEAHQLTAAPDEDFVYYVIADNPRGDSCYYPDSGKWVAFKEGGEEAIAKGEEVDYYLDEE